MSEENQLTEFQAIIGVHFLDPNMLRRALTHRSFVNEVDDKLGDNERLEFLGDAILDFIVADMLFRRFPDISEGELTQLRSALVRTDSLALLAGEIHLGDYLFIGKGEENTGGRKRVNILCRGYEALIGAIYIDRGLDAVRDFALPRLNALLEYILENDLHKDARSMLQELSQAELRYTPLYHVTDAIGPEHEKQFFVQVMIGELVIGEGTGSSKRSGAQAAARDGLQKVEEFGWPEEAYNVPSNLDGYAEAEPALILLDDEDTVLPPVNEELESDELSPKSDETELEVDEI